MSEDEDHRGSGQLLEITVAGPVASRVLALLDERYDQVVSRSEAVGTVLTVADADQACERAVLTLLWDTGHRLHAVARRTPTT